jgi:hypothetical protein
MERLQEGDPPKQIRRVGHPPGTLSYSFCPGVTFAGGSDGRA